MNIISIHEQETVVHYWLESDNKKEDFIINELSSRLLIVQFQNFSIYGYYSDHLGNFVF